MTNKTWADKQTFNFTFRVIFASTVDRINLLAQYHCHWTDKANMILKVNKIRGLTGDQAENKNEKFRAEKLQFNVLCSKHQSLI